MPQRSFLLIVLKWKKYLEPKTFQELTVRRFLNTDVFEFHRLR